MSLWRQLTRGIRVLVERHAADQELTDELQHYLDESAAAHVARGLSPNEARQAAQRELGNLTIAREQVRAYGWENVIETLGGDLRYAARRLRSNPGFTIVSVLTLALGIGATTAIFSVIDPILLKPLPYPRAGEIVTVADRANDGSPVPATYGTYAELSARSRSFESMAAIDRWQPSLVSTSEPERLVGQRVSAGYFRTLGVGPVVGRDFLDGDDQRGAPAVVILSDRLVQRRFGGDNAVVGRQIMLDGDQYLVIGVMPPHFANVLAPAADVWTPLQERAQAPFNSREWGHHYEIVGRLRQGVSAALAMSESKNIGKTPVPQFGRPPWATMGQGMLVNSLQDEISGESRPALLAIVGAVVLLLAIACVNVTNLLLARNAQRRGELAMRSALGAGRRRLLRQLLTETLLLTIIGGLCGLAIAEAGVRALIALSPPGLPRLEAIRVDGWAFVFALVASALIGIAIGIIPAIGASRGLTEGLQQGARRTAPGQGTARRLLVIAEVSLALVLLVSAGLLMRSLEHLFGVTPGFNASHVLTMQVVDAGHGYPSDSLRRQYYEQVLAAVQQVPGVTGSALTTQLPLSGDLDAYGSQLASSESKNPGDDGNLLRYVVTPGYLKTMGIPLLRGRTLEASDAWSMPEAILISDSYARKKFKDRNPIGERVRLGPEIDGDRPWDVIVGVVGDVKQESLAAGSTDAFYVALGHWRWVDKVQSLVVRTSGDPSALVPSVKRAIWSVDANQPIERVVTMDRLIALSASQRRFALVVIETFALSALILAAVGIYGVLSGSVSERMREIGVRSALGASRRDIITLVVGQGLSLTTVGVILGLGGAIGATRAIVSLMFGVSRLDPITYGGVVALLIVVSAIACWLPAWRAARVDPVITLRAE